MLVLAQVHPAVTASLIAVFLFVCVLLILAVLIQRPAGGGLSGAFGSGAGSGQTAFGAKTGDALTIATITVFLIYLLFAIGLNFAARPSVGGPPPAVPAPAAPAAPAGGTGQTAPPPATIPTPDPEAPAGTGQSAPAAPAGAQPAGETPPPVTPEPVPGGETPPTPPPGSGG
jgi:preprotein translocase subunit SecG